MSAAEILDDAPAPSQALTPEQQAMVAANVNLVRWWVARKFRNVPELVAEEHVANGMLGLIRAVQKYQPEKGFTFSTYASWWIRQAIDRGVAYSEGIGYRQTVGWNSSGRDLSAWVRPASLDAPIGDDARSRFGDTLADPNVDVEADATSRADAARLLVGLRSLCRDEIDLAIVQALHDGQPVADVTRHHDLTYSEVRYRQGRLLARARHPVHGLFARTKQHTNKERAMTITDLLPPAPPNGQHAVPRPTRDEAAPPPRNG